MKVYPHGWGDHFGNSLTYSLSITGYQFVSNATVFKEDPAFALLKGGKVTCCYAKGNKAIVSYPLDFVSSSEMSQHYKDSYSKAEQVATMFPNRDAHYWMVQKGLREHFTNILTRRDSLSIGWVSSCAVLVDEAVQVFRMAASTLFPSTTRNVISQHSLSFLNAIKANHFSYYASYNIFSEAAQADSNYLRSLLGDIFALAGSEGAEWQSFINAVAYCFYTYQTSPTVTRCGKRVSWLDGQAVESKTIDIEVDALPDSFDTSSYWPSILWPNVPDHRYRINWGMLISGSSIPASPVDIAYPESNLPVTEDVAEVTASADALLEEAVASKKWTIPPGARVQLEFGPFRYLDVHEICDEVYFVCRTPQEAFWIVCVKPSGKICTFSSFPSANTSDDSTAQDAIRNAAVKLLLSAVIRDFWVVEEREKVFACNKTTRRVGSGDTHDLPIVVYLPKIRYTGTPNVQHCENNLGQQERRAHFVRAHLRKSDNPSTDQVFLAQRYGFAVPVGYTFVRPHERGTKPRDLIYRSRSALQSLYSVIEYEGNAVSSWFKFERDVNKMMQNLGFVSEHIAASKRGDNSVDVYASKGNGPDRVNWIIQCKCYSPNRKSAPELPVN